MSKGFFITLTTIGFVVVSACSQTKKEGVANEHQSNSIDTAHSSRNSLDWSGVYHGVLVNDKEKEVQTEVRLNEDLTYELASRESDKKSVVKTESGTFFWSEDGSAVELKRRGRVERFKVAENKLIRLDKKVSDSTGEASENALIKEEEGIQNKYWKLIELNGRPVKVSDKFRREPHFILRADSTINGHGGCNGFGGNYQLEGMNGVRFSQLMSTLMACEGVEFEPEYFRMFEEIDNYTLKSDTLSLNKGKRAPSARFISVYFN